jgi:hypothetical protein
MRPQQNTPNLNDADSRTVTKDCLIWLDSLKIFSNRTDTPV